MWVQAALRKEDIEGRFMKNKDMTVEEALRKITEHSPVKIVLSNVADKEQRIQKVQIEKKEKHFQIAQYSDKQVFHKNVDEEELISFCIEELGVNFLQLNAWMLGGEASVKLTKKGKLLFSLKKSDNSALADEIRDNNRKKNYILEEGRVIEPLIDMGIFTKEGKIVSSMYDKFKQINRFIEIIDDELKKKIITHLNIIDFGCGKSYLTLHACDMATDFALYNAINWGANYIFSVPCCQHELNAQIKSETFSLMTRYGIIKERFSALVTDAIRGNLLEYMGYNVNLLEFVDLSHTPKNILIRAVKNPNKSENVKLRAMDEVNRMMEEFGLSQALYRMIEG